MVHSLSIDKVRQLSTLDSCLTWSFHIDAVINKCMGMPIRLSHLRRVLPLKTIVLLINTLVLPHINFGIVLWENCKNTQGKRMNVHQGRKLIDWRVVANYSCRA